MSVNSEDHVLGLWIGGGVTPSALREIAGAIDHWIEAHEIAGSNLSPKVEMELRDIANACEAQLTKLPKTVAALTEECDLV